MTAVACQSGLGNNSEMMIAVKSLMQIFLHTTEKKTQQQNESESAHSSRTKLTQGVSLTIPYLNNLGDNHKLECDPCVTK